jgi:sulfite reductase alpha subunit-like flavoprotein
METFTTCNVDLQVLENRELQGPSSSRSTRHVQLALPAGEAGQYSAGDHLEVMGNNDKALVEAALKRLNLTGEGASAAVRSFPLHFEPSSSLCLPRLPGTQNRCVLRRCC